MRTRARAPFFNSKFIIQNSKLGLDSDFMAPGWKYNPAKNQGRHLRFLICDLQFEQPFNRKLKI